MAKTCFTATMVFAPRMGRWYLEIIFWKEVKKIKNATSIL
jgi:hypothetical protein